MYYVLCNTASSRARRRASAVPNTPTHTWAVAAALIPGMAAPSDDSADVPMVHAPGQRVLGDDDQDDSGAALAARIQQAGPSCVGCVTRGSYYWVGLWIPWFCVLCIIQYIVRIIYNTVLCITQPCISLRVLLALLMRASLHLDTPFACRLLHRSARRRRRVRTTQRALAARCLR